MEADPYRPVLYAACGIAYLLLLALVVLARGKSRSRTIFGGACALTAIWAAAWAIPGSNDIAVVTELASRLAWCGFILHLIQRRDGRQAGHRMLIASIGVILVAVFAFGLVPGAALMMTGSPEASYLAMIWGHMALGICGILCAENLYRNTEPDHRWHVNMLCVALGGVFAFDFILYADAFLNRRVSQVLLDGRAIVTMLAAPLLVVAVARNRDWTIPIHVSRTVVFHTATLVLSGCFLLGLALAGEVVRYVRPDWGGVAEVSLLAAGAMTIGVMLTSASARSRLRYLLARHFFSHRYDYRRAWLRSSEILSAVSDDAELSSRIIRTVAEIADSPAGLLLVRDIGGRSFQWAGSWNKPAISVSEPADGKLVEAFRDDNWIVELERLGDRPQWLAEISNAWLAVPLAHSNHLIGFVILSHPRAPVPLDLEAFDLLRIVGRQAAAHLAQQQYAEALVDAHRLHDYGKRFAFAIHDMKNVVSQLRMVVSNAQIHGDNPEFQEDVLVTVRSAVSNLDRLLARMRSPQPAPSGYATVPIEIVRKYIEDRGRTHSDLIELDQDGGAGEAAISAEDLRAVITHLCENAIEVSEGPVRIGVRHEPHRTIIDVVDTGAGMTAEFVRDELFHPFGSTKADGFGIGAFQARELIRAAGGDILVLSRPRHGTTMRLILPSAVRQPTLVSRLSAQELET